MKNLFLLLSLLPLVASATDPQLAACQAINQSLQQQIVGYSGVVNKLSAVTVAIDLPGFKGDVPYSALKDASDLYAKTGATKSPNQILSFGILGGEDHFTIGLAELQYINQIYLMGPHRESHTVSSCK